MDARWSAVPVFHADLRFSIRCEIGERLLKTHGRKFSGKTVRQPDRKGDEGRCLITGKSEGGHLVPDRNALDLFISHGVLINRSPVFPGELFQACHDTAGFFIEGVLVISDLADYLPCQIREIHIHTGL